MKLLSDFKQAILSHLQDTIQLFNRFVDDLNKPIKITIVSGIYSFWWHNENETDRLLLMGLNRKVFLKGKS